MKPLALLRALRPHQWVKNVFVFAALVFARGERDEGLFAGDLSDVRDTVLAFLAFCAGASAIYLINDVMDVEQDRAHPQKRLRPIASGELTVGAALVSAGLLVAAALCLGLLADGGRALPTSALVPDASVAAVVAAYMGLNFLYSVRLKHVVLVDAFCIATGFLLRVYAGGLAAGADVSHWLLLCTLFLALFLALCKRRAEIDLLGDGRGQHRAILLEYDRGFLDQMVTVLASCTILTYTMYTVSEDTAAKFGDDHRMIWTVPFVVFGLGRYMLLVQTRQAGGSPTRVLLGGDPLFLANTLAWVATVALVVFHVL
jgi:4-hydroxybenzoate polyprenyltransferase